MAIAHPINIAVSEVNVHLSVYTSCTIDYPKKDEKALGKADSKKQEKLLHYFVHKDPHFSFYESYHGNGNYAKPLLKKMLPNLTVFKVDIIRNIVLGFKSLYLFRGVNWGS